MRQSRFAGLAVIAGMLLSLAAGAQTPPAPSGDFPVPRFRHIDPSESPPDTKQLGTIRFLADADFPPFSYRDQQGALTGFSVAVAEAVCAELRLTCEFLLKPWEEIEGALGNREGDAVLSGIRISERTLKTLDFTRPYLRTLGRFAARAESLPLSVDPRSLADKRLGVVAGTTHEAFLKQRFPRSSIQPYDNDTAAREALKAGAVDALFGDGFQLMFWLSTPASEKCCLLVPGAYAEPVGISVPIAIAVRREANGLRQALDYGLDRIQADGTYEKLYRQFFPMSVW